MKIIYLQPRSARRTELRSDTWWGLLCWGIRYVWDEPTLATMITQFNLGAPPFLLSSVFPYRAENGKRTLFLPKPLLEPFRMEDSEMNPEVVKQLKNYKKVAHVSLPIFRALVSGSLTEKDYFLNHSREWQQSPSLMEIKQILVQNTIDRLSGGTPGEGGLYNSEVYFYPPGAGLYFLLRILDPAYEKILAALWPFFEHVGLGKDASTGKGAYFIREESVEDFTVTPSPARFITLSLYSPTPAEMKVFVRDQKKFWYKIATRQGRLGGKLFVTPHILKQPLRMLAEGSSFPALDKPFYGGLRLVKDVQDIPHKVYQYGYAFTVPCQ